MRFHIALCALAVALGGCSKRVTPLGSGFTDHFDRRRIGNNYDNTGGPYRIEHGALVVALAHNHPLWLKRKLPHDVQVDVDVTGYSPDGDMKVELFGDGKSHESDDAVRRDLIYTASGYVFIFGGWHNSRSVLVRQNEHTWQFDKSVPLRTEPKVQPGHTYHWTITRRGAHLDWKIDGKPFLSWDDPHPLNGSGHDRFGFTGWETKVAFDNLVIKPL